MDVLRETVRECYKEQLREIKLLVEKGGEHMLICGLDAGILRMVVAIAEEYAMSLQMEVQHISSAARSEDTENKVLVLDLPMNQSLIYHYLERTRKSSCCLVLTSTSCLCLESLEKRVKSRFNHRIFFFGFLPEEAYIQLHRRISGERADKSTPEELKQVYRISPSVKALAKRIMMERYKIPQYTNAEFYRLLNPIHFALLILSKKRRIARTNVLDEFRRFTSRTSELKKAEDTEVIFYYIDLVEAGAIDKDGGLGLSWIELKDFISGHCPLFIRSLV
jgi:origin recognition complex subunit 4